MTNDSHIYEDTYNYTRPHTIYIGAIYGSFVREYSTNHRLAREALAEVRKHELEKAFLQGMKRGKAADDHSQNKFGEQQQSGH